MISSLIFGRICIFTVYLCVYGYVDAGFYHSGDEIIDKFSVYNRFNNG